MFTLNLIAAASDSAILLGMIKTSTGQITIGGGGGGRIGGGGGGRIGGGGGGRILGGGGGGR
jgi:hypothetical protein